MKYLDAQDMRRIRDLAGRSQGAASRGTAGGMNFGKFSSRNPDSEFAEHRSHNAGEGARFIDWKVYARKEKFYVKDFLQERKINWEIFFDASASMGFSAEYRRLFVRCALYACGILLLRGEKINLHLLNEKETFSRTGLCGFEKIILLDDFFYSVRFSGGNFMVRELPEKLSGAVKSSKILFFSDLFFPREKLDALAGALASFPGEKIFFHFFEEDLGKIIAPGAEVVLSDSETGEEFAFEYSGFRKILDERHKKWLEECHSVFSGGNSRYFRVSGEKDFISLRELVADRKI